MSFTKAEQQILLNKAVGRAEYEGDAASDISVRDWLEEQRPPRTEAERIQIDRIAIRAVAAVDLARRMRERLTYRPRAGTYGSIPIAYSGEEGYTYRVVLRSEGVGADPAIRGVMIVRSDTPLSGLRVVERALDMGRQLEQGDPYYDPLVRRGGGLSYTADIVSAIHMGVR
jgi:hypothetical protein